MLRFIQLKISQRALLLFALLAVVPVLALNSYWLVSQQRVLRDEVKGHQALFTDSAATQVNQFMAAKISALILHAQTSSVLRANTTDAKFELTNYVKQDSDVRHITFLGKNGNMLTEVDSPTPGSNVPVQELPSTDTAFKVATFLGGKEYISPVTFIGGQPYVQIAVPILTFERAQDFSQLSTSEKGVIRGPNDINGALVVLVNLDSIWSTVFAGQTAETNMSYILDGQKNLISYPTNTMPINKDLASVPSIQYFFDNPKANSVRTIETKGLSGKQVLTTFARVPLTDWVVITEDPIIEIDKTVQNVARQVGLLDILVTLVALAIAYYFSRTITGPIRKLADDARQMGSGNFDVPIAVDSDDEVGSLAQSLNRMSQRLKTLIMGITAERKQLDIVLNSINEGVFALDANGIIKFVNQSALDFFGMSANELLNKNFMMVTSFSRDSDKMKIDLDSIDQTKRFAEYYDLQCVNKRNQQRYLDLLIGKVEHSEDDINYIVTIIDQTASRELEIMKIDFVSLAAHELRTPLTSIRGYLDLMLNDTNDVLSEDHRHYALQASDSSVQLSSLINNLLDVSKIERNALKVSVEEHDLASTIVTSVQNQRFNAERAGVKLTYDGPQEGVLVAGDPVALREVVDNLIINAIHYTPANGEVVVSLEQTGSDVTVHVKDTGIGIAKEVLPKLFTKFFRVHGGLATGSGGSGLGLFISKSLIGLHGGSIWVDSEESQGSTFSFKLPVFDASELKVHAESDTNNNKELPARRHRGWVTKNSARR